MVLLLLLSLNFSHLAQAEDQVTCETAFNQAIMSCSAHEQAINAQNLSLVSGDTRVRVVRYEEIKLGQFKTECRKHQERCTKACESELETASIEGEDLSRPLDRLNDCRQGEIPKQLQAMDRKIIELRRMSSIKKSAHIGGKEAQIKRSLATSTK